MCFGFFSKDCGASVEMALQLIAKKCSFLRTQMWFMGKSSSDMFLDI